MEKEVQSASAMQALKLAIRQKQPQRLYFFHGEEVFLLQHYLQQLRKLLIDELTGTFNFHKLTAEAFTLQDFANAVENLPMMAEHTMVWVDEVDIFKLPEDDREKLVQIFSDIPDYCTVAFTYETTPWKPDKQLKKLREAVEHYGTVVEFPKQEQRDLIAWITRHFATQGKEISTELCSYLIDITGGTMTALGSEILKICAYSDAARITKSDIDAVTEPVLDAVVFQMAGLLGERAYGAALQKLQQLFKMQQEPLSILGTVGNHFRRLSTARILIDNGKQAALLAKLYDKMSDYAANRTMRAARQFSVQFYTRASELVLETDYRIKTSFDDPKRLLETLIIQLAQEAQNG